MKKRSHLIAVYLCLLTLFSLGTGELLLGGREARPSYTENRMLAAFPALSFASLRDGSFMDGFESWLSDAFFFRDEAAAFSDGTKALFSIPDPEAAQTGLDQDRLFQADEERQGDLEQALEQDLRQALPDPPAPGEGEAERADGRPRGKAASGAALWLERNDGTRSIYAELSAAQIDRLAEVLGEYRAELPEDGTVHLLYPPTSALANQVIRGYGCRAWGDDLRDALQPIVGEGILIHDSFAIAEPWLRSERLYPTVDHHWHPFFACQAVKVMLGAQGVPTGDYYDHRYTLANSPYKGVYGEQELKSLDLNAETVEVMQPLAPAESYIVKHLTERSDSVVVDPDAQGYRQYLSGTRAPWRLFFGGYRTGRRALVISDSFGNCMIPYLLPYYDLVLSTDFRDNGYAIFDAGANARDYIQSYGIDDVYFLFCSGTPLDSEIVQDRLERYLYLDYGALLGEG